MASQEQLILAQLGAESADIFKPEVDTGSGFVQDITAGVMGAQTFDESAYALEGAVKDFRKDYYKGDIKEDSLMGKIGLKAFGPNVKFSELSSSERRDIRRGPQFETRMATEISNPDAFKFNADLFIKNLQNDFESGTENVELASNGEMITKPFDVKKEIIDPALKAEVDVPTTFVGPVGNVFKSELEEIFAPSADLLSDNYSSQYSLSQMEQLPESFKKEVASMPSGYFNLMDDQVKNNYDNFIVKDRINTLLEFGDTFGYGGGNQDINAIPKVQGALDVYTKKYMEKKGYSDAD